MATRTVVSYDDITLPYDVEDVPPPPPPQPPKSSAQPPNKKRKKSNNQKGKHWDDPSANGASNSFKKHTKRAKVTTKKVVSYSAPEQEDEDMEGEYEDGEYEEEDEESRELTHEEIWDDSALVNAWESAMEEYKAYHGGEEAWKAEPVKKSPLWYNVPIDTTEKPVKTSPITPAVIIPSVGPSTAKAGGEDDSRPLNFDTFVPSHDPSLETPAAASAASYVPETPAGAMVSQDEAFSRALNAMYWSGYWTAMYHAQRQMPQSTAQPSAQPSAQSNAQLSVQNSSQPSPLSEPTPPILSDNIEEVEEAAVEEAGEEAYADDDNEDIEVDENGDFISTQR